MSALGQKADIRIAKSDVRFTPESDIKCAYGMSAKGQADFVKRFLIKGGYVFTCVFLASIGAPYISADARLNWNKGELLTLCSCDGPLELSIR